jgi:cytochrome c biogenesis protein CcmG/thiol:disulfide interchange protein DsbE
MSVAEPAPAGRGKLWAAVPLAIFLALSALFLYRLTTGGDASRIPSALIGRTVPETVLPPLQGLMREGQPVPGFGPRDLKSGRVTLVNVFASWCAPCHAEHPFLLELAKDARIRLIGINQKDTTENARSFLGLKGNPYAAVGVDPNGRASIEWGVYGVPETFIVRGDGTIAHKLVGPVTEQNLAAFRAEIEKALR